MKENKDSRIELVKYLTEICKKEKAKLGKGYNQYGIYIYWIFLIQHSVDNSFYKHCCFA